MALHIPVAITSLSCAATVIAFAQGLLPGHRRGCRVLRSLGEVFLALIHCFTLILVLTAESTPGDRIYVICASTFLALFIVLDVGREIAFQIRAPFTDFGICTIPSIVAVNIVSIAQFGTMFCLLTFSTPATVDYCGHDRYVLRDVAPLFAAAVYAAWTLHEHVGLTALPKALCCSVARFRDDADDEERDLWVKHKVKSALGFEAALESFQIIMILSTVVFTAVVIEILAVRRERCSGVWNAAKTVFPLLVSGSGVVAARTLAIRLKDWIDIAPNS